MSDPAWTLTYDYTKSFGSRSCTQHNERPYSRPLGQMCATYEPDKGCDNWMFCKSWDKSGQGKPAPPFYGSSVKSECFVCTWVLMTPQKARPSSHSTHTNTHTLRPNKQAST